MYLAAVISMIFLIGIDQFTKFLTVKYLMPVHSVNIINNFFELTYVENRGAAFGFLQGAKWLFVIMAIVILIFGTVYYIRLSKKDNSRLTRTAIVLIGSGAIGNVIDRLFRGYVVDMLNFNIFGYDFPVFNFADICVCVGAAIIVIAIFFSKEEA